MQRYVQGQDRTQASLLPASPAVASISASIGVSTRPRLGADFVTEPSQIPHAPTASHAGVNRCWRLSTRAPSVAKAVWLHRVRIAVN
jgi:hypothetical protein